MVAGLSATLYCSKLQLIAVGTSGYAYTHVEAQIASSTHFLTILGRLLGVISFTRGISEFLCKNDHVQKVKWLLEFQRNRSSRFFYILSPPLILLSVPRWVGNPVVSGVSAYSSGVSSENDAVYSTLGDAVQPQQRWGQGDPPPPRGWRPIVPYPSHSSSNSYEETRQCWCLGWRVEGGAGGWGAGRSVGRTGLQGGMHCRAAVGRGFGISGQGYGASSQAVSACETSFFLKGGRKYIVGDALRKGALL